ncbi:hypothetical protein KUTeg_015330 [Tegillarca granosa]|uniref:UBZ1-type domain-containing protein n=1 Tax=Tegillarca granosa TaxID=220873 RepID=A0ABQ9ES85_TEGGR|nr:hypothetical protein KUTeg_015330 [Tegillarca granosa]
MDSRGRMQNENEDDIDVLSNGDTQNMIDDAIEPLIDIRSAQRQQLFYSSAGNLEDNAASLHSLKLSYDALKKRYNELEIRNQTMQKAITEMESERLGKDRLNPRTSLTGCDAAGPAASASPDAGTAEGSMANVRAHLGYAQRLERQILRLQKTMDEQTQKFQKTLEDQHNEKEIMKKIIIEKDEEIKKLKNKSLENGSSKSQQPFEKEIRDLKSENEKLGKELEEQKPSGVSLSSSVMDLSRRIDGSSMSALYNDPQVTGPSSPRSPKSSFDQQKSQSQNYPPLQFSHSSNYQKGAISSSTYRNMSAPTLQSDYHDGSFLQDDKTPTQTGARPKIGSSPRNLEFSPIIDDFSINPNQTTQVAVRTNSNVNIQSNEPNAATFAPNILRQGGITSKQPQQNTEVIDSNKVRLDRDGTQIHHHFAGNNPPQISVSPQRTEKNLPSTSDHLFGPNGKKIESKSFKIPQQNEDLLFNAPDQIVENDYVNIWGNNETANRPVIQETGGQGNVHNSTVNRCPVCSQEFPGMDMQEFQMHVLHCIDDSNDEPQTIQNQNRVDSNNRICPMCDAVFPSELPQEEFENHVQEHFGEERFEVLQTPWMYSCSEKFFCFHKIVKQVFTQHMQAATFKTFQMLYINVQMYSNN